MLTDNILLSAGYDKILNLWDITNPQNSFKTNINCKEQDVIGCRYLCNLINNCIAISSQNDIIIYLVEKSEDLKDVNLKYQRKLHGHKERIWSLANNLEDLNWQNLLLSGSSDRSCKLWNYQLNTCLKTYEIQIKVEYLLVIDGRYFLAGGWKQWDEQYDGFRVVDKDKGGIVVTNTESGIFNGEKINEKQLVTCCRDGKLRFYNL